MNGADSIAALLDLVDPERSPTVNRGPQLVVLGLAAPVPKHARMAKLISFPLGDLEQVVFINPSHVIGVRRATDKLVDIAMMGEEENSIFTPGKAEVVVERPNRGTY